MRCEAQLSGGRLTRKPLREQEVTKRRGRSVLDPGRLLDLDARARTFRLADRRHPVVAHLDVGGVSFFEVLRKFEVVRLWQAGVS